MSDKKRNLLIGGVATLLLGLFALSFLINEEVPDPVLMPVPVVEEVHMPPPPPAASPEQIAAADAAAAALLASATAEESAMKADTVTASAGKKKSAVKAKAAVDKPAAAKSITVTDADARAKADADARLADKRSNEKKDLERIPAPDATVAAEPAKPKEARFNMTQGGKKMTPEDFDAWMKAQGIRIVPAKPVAPVPDPAPVTEEKKGS